MEAYFAIFASDEKMEKKKLYKLFENLQLLHVLLHYIKIQ